MTNLLNKLANAEVFADELLSVVSGSMKEILRKSAHDENTWEHLSERVRIHGLLNLKTPSRFKPAELHIEQDKLDDVRYRRSLIRKLKAPRPCKWVYHNVAIDRGRVLDDENYLNDMAKVLAHRWVAALLPVSKASTCLILLKMDAWTVEHCLYRLGPHQMDGDAVALLMLHLAANEALNRNPTFAKVKAELEIECAKIRHEFEHFTRALAKEHLRSFDASMKETLAHVNAEADKALASARAELSSTANACQTALDAAPTGDVEALWREQLAKRDEERRAKSTLRRFARRVRSFFT